jgi:hypothetical protein
MEFGAGLDLPLGVLELALGSEKLQLASENDAYALVGGWVASGPASEQQGAFNRLVRCLRLHHMSAAFLTSVVAWSEFRSECAYLLQACTNALMYQSVAATLSRLKDSERDEYLASGKADRARAVPRYTFTAQVDLADCLKLDDDHDTLSMRLGVADGYPVQLDAKRRSREGGKFSLGLFFFVCHPNVINGGEEVGATIGLGGPMVDVRIEAFDTENKVVGLFSQEAGWGIEDFFNKTWGEVVRENSDYFPNGRMTIEIRATFISDKHEEWSEPASDEDEEGDEEED